MRGYHEADGVLGKLPCPEVRDEPLDDLPSDVDESGFAESEQDVES